MIKVAMLNYKRIASKQIIKITLDQRFIKNGSMLTRQTKL